MSSYVFTDTDVSAAAEGFMQELTNWCAEKYIQCYVLKKPLIEVKSDYEGGDSYAVLIPKRKILFVNFDQNNNAFEEYVEDFIEDIGYISNKYNYKEKIGRPKSWTNDLTVKIQVKESLGIGEYLENTDLNDLFHQRISELLVSLVTGSINDIDRVGINVPENDLDRIKRNILLFDGDQTRFVYQSLKQKVVRIQGLSGTGKTELLLHKLKELYVSEGKSKIIMTCHNKILAANLRRRIPGFFNFMKVEQQIEWDKRLYCVHGWGSQNDPTSGSYAAICGHYNLTFYPWSKLMDFDRVCKLALKELGEKEVAEGDYAFDYMLIDESQDFPESFFELCGKVTRNSIYIAGDIFQSIFDERKEAGGQPEFILSKCYRTAPATLMFAQALGMGYFEPKKLNWLSNEDLEACGYLSKTDAATKEIILKREPISRFEDIKDENESVSLIRISGNYIAQCSTKIIECLHEIKKSYPNVEPADIGIIMIDRGKSSYEISDRLTTMIPREMGWPVNKAYETRQPSRPGEIFLSNTNHVKGLEFPFVICATHSLSDSFSHRNSLYMAITRSFLKTYFIVKEDSNTEALNNIQAGLDNIIKEHVLRVTPPSEAEQEQIKAKVKWQGSLKTFDEVAMEVLIEFNVTGKNADKLLSAMKIMLDANSERDEILKLAKKLISE
ncbi:AAA family ATPase [Pseudomonas aeruginosa]|uniref:DEAD/DEAH box helicase n=1 Tax=Pseudomonas aeruginosa TaxID=287 RepID=UPI002498B0DB|nr:ATP-binding domain-containing protein [Pseudomonas aeruginosa]MDI2524690.1 AAA family ATPase [Pseudomonas aeruginosa]